MLNFADASTFTYALSTPKFVKWSETVLNIVWLPAWELNLSSTRPLVSTCPPNSNLLYLAQLQPEALTAKESEPAVREGALEWWHHSHQIYKMVLSRVWDCSETEGSTQ